MWRSPKGRGVEGKPIRIIEPQADHSFKLNTKELKSVLLSDDIKNKKVVVISITGAFRTGKSFFLNFLLSFLQQHNARRSSTLSNESDFDSGWLEALELSFKSGFSWKHGDKRDTDGVVMWSKPFILQTNSEDVALILLDTQGSFDDTQTVNDCAVIFALATLISSCQVYNLINTIREDDISNLLYFTQYGKMAKDDEKQLDEHQKPFQRLLFFVRDWKAPSSYPYGKEGGALKLQEVLRVSDTSNQEAVYSRQRLQRYFQDVECFLMPHPGLKVATGDAFNGRLEDIEVNFMEQLKNVIHLLLDDEHLKPKQIAGKDITAGELYTCIETYMKVISSGKLPTMKNCFLATAEATHLNAMSEAVDYYHKSMQNVCGGSKSYVKDTELEKVHETVSRAAVNQFVATKRVGGSIFEKQFCDKLKNRIEQAAEEYRQSNESKKSSMSVSTPAILIVFIAFSAICWSVLAFLHINFAADIVEVMIWVWTSLLATWWTVSLMGVLRPIRGVIDKVVGVMWKFSFSVIFKKAFHRLY